MKDREELLELWDLLLNNPKAHAEMTPYGVHTLAMKSDIDVRVDLSCEPNLEIEPDAGHLSFRNSTFELTKEEVLKLRSEFNDKKNRLLDDIKEVLK